MRWSWRRHAVGALALVASMIRPLDQMRLTMSARVMSRRALPASWESYCGSQGWLEVGRWPAALRFSAHDDRDEVLMDKSLLRGEPSAPAGAVR
jgi:hypothetical protein